ncbi:hypothetical protein BGZ73_005666 [Actinomortierella ambigua]|nr:hypothetical protein BGZ73_005666 [Actinomortierella ambigua]
MKKQKLSIVLGTVPKTASDSQSEEDIFYPGDVVAGQVTYNPTSNLKYCCIKIRFTGTVETKVSKTQDQVYVINQQSVLLGNANHESEYVLDEGEYAWSFEFALPMQHIPSAGKYRHGSVKYTLVAIITSKGFLGGMQEQKCVKQIIIRDLINCTAAPHSDSVQQSESFNLKPKTNKPKNVVSATVQLARSAFLPGQQLKVDVNFVHPIGFNRNPACWIQLVRKERYQAADNIKEYTHVVAQSSHAIKIDHEDKTGFVKAFLEIPKDSLYTTSTTKILTVNYHLHVLSDMRVKTGMFEGRNPAKITKKLREKLKSAQAGLETEIPITIGTLADVNHAPRVAKLTTLTASSTISPSSSVAASSSGFGFNSAPTLTSSSTISVPASTSGTSNASITMTPTLEPVVPPLPPPKDGYSAHKGSPKYTPQVDLFQGASSSSSSAVPSHTITGKGKRVEQVAAHVQGSSSSSSASSSSATSPRSVGTSSFSLQPILNALPDSCPSAVTSGSIPNGGTSKGINPAGRRSSHPTLSAAQSSQLSDHPTLPHSPAPQYHTLPSRQIQYATPLGQQNPVSATRTTTAIPSANLLPRFHTQPHPSQSSQPSPPSQPSQPSYASQPSVHPLPPLVPRFISVGELPHSSQPLQPPYPPQANGTQGHTYVFPPAATLNMRPLPVAPRPSLQPSRSALSVPLMAAPGHSMDPQAHMAPPRPPPKPTTSQASPLAQPTPHGAGYHHASATSASVPGSYGRPGPNLPRMASTPDIAYGYGHAGGHYPADNKTPPSPVPVVIDPPFQVAMTHRESPTAPRAIDLGYGPASPGLDGPRSPFSNTVVVHPTMTSPAPVHPINASPAPHALSSSQPRHQPSGGDYFTVTSLAPAPAPVMMSHTANVAMAPASAPRFSLVFGTSSNSSTAPSTPIGMAGAPMVTTAAAAMAPVPTRVAAANGSPTGMVVMSSLHDGRHMGVAPPYAPSAANGHRTV